MINSLKFLMKMLFPGRLLCISFSPLFIISCSSLSKKISLQSKNLIFKIQWEHSDPLKREHRSFWTLVSVQGNNLLRTDLLQPLIGVIGSLIVTDQRMTVLAPLHRQYYEGEFDSKVFFPDFSSFPNTWLTALLRVKALEQWDCQKQDQKLIQCQTDYFEIEWKYKKNQLNIMYIKELKQRQITARVKSLSSKKFSPTIFKPSLKNWTRQKDPLFFHKL